MGETVWTHIGIVAVPTLMILGMWIDSRARAERTAEVRDGREREAKKDVEERDARNQEKLDTLIAQNQFLRPHDHIEASGPLCAEGIVRKRNGK